MSRGMSIKECSYWLYQFYGEHLIIIKHPKGQSRIKNDAEVVGYPKTDFQIVYMLL